MIGTRRPSPERFPLVLAAAALALLSAAGCGGGGGGGGGGGLAPTITSAAFVGGGAPAVGNVLLLTFSEAIVLSGSALTNDDVVLSAGASLGSVTAPPTQPATNTLSLLLGTGVSFVPGTTTIALGPGNDVVRNSLGRLGTGGTPVVIGTSDGLRPTITNVTIAAIDDALNGTGPAGGTLQLPPNGFTIDVAYNDNSAIAVDSTRITASVAVATSAGTINAGDNLRPFLTTVRADNTGASYRVPTTTTFPNGPVTLTALVTDISGLGSTPSTFAAAVATFRNELRPFETNANASQIWFLDFSRDVEQFATSAITGGLSVDVTQTANGRADFVDLLFILGLAATSPLPNVQGNRDSNEVTQDLFKQALLVRLGELYAGCNVQFTLTQPAGNFGTSASVAYSSFGFSRIAIGGAPSSPGVLGVAIFDDNNATQNDNTRLDFSGTRLGIFLQTIVDSGFGPPASSLFRQTFAPFTPGFGGTPIGGNSQDGQRLLGTLTDGRSDAIATAITDLAHFCAVVTAHECGHSMGLVQNGAMPTGLYGNDSTNFPGSSDGHIRNTALFPAGSTNVMSPSLSYTAAINASTAFNSLNLAYLREQVFYGN
jgi:hypothetical protein